ncbi:hypothetical protein [Bifidobacterium moukalabense]|uniref:Uncharacterized protein n=1 Tax=Bifidobacterium moukalabense DSM 27321 TaxID=1435051 RepID=W4N9H7_9BIFI|nr:hypothetical protein [Bifidobacterium moukalabense]ETY71707.1 hypothetical protein BMOU_0787 [Bifidobacterium moukalabense DSM 27321]
MSADQEAREHYTRVEQRYFDYLNREYGASIAKSFRPSAAPTNAACETASTPHKLNCANTSTCATRTSDEGLA